MASRSASTSSRGRMDRDEIGLREVPVVLRLLLRAQRRRVLVAGVEVEGLLVDRAAGLVDPDLARDLALDPLRGEVERVHVLQLRPRPQLVGAVRTDGDVDVEAHRALLELRVGEAELDDGLAQELQEPLRVVGRVDVGRGDDLEQRRAAPVEVDERRGRAVDAAGGGDVDVLGRVLLEVGADDADLDRRRRASARRAARPSRAARRTGRSGTPSAVVRIEVVLAVEHGPLGDPRSRVRARA